jgi:uncharacterized protein YkwD
VASRARLVAVALGGLALAACAGAPPAGRGAPPSGTDPFATVNAARSRGCGERSTRVVALRADARLDAVAARLPRGEPLAAAIAAERYPAARSASIHVTRAVSADALYQLLTARFCADVADPAFQSIGIAGRGDEIWIVFAAPFTAPAVADAGAVARRVLALVNEARAKPRRCGGQLHAVAQPLALDATLGAAAAAHARDLARTGRMSHEGSDGSTAAERVTRAGYAWRTVAENVAAGDTTADAVMKTWLASPGHCANLMSPDVRDMGVAWAFNAASPKGTYWAQVFATRR